MAAFGYLHSMDFRCLRRYILLLLLGGLTTAAWAQAADQEAHAMVALRSIGHQLLLSAGDSSTRVLPIVVEDDLYQIHFDGPFVFMPDSLIEIVSEVVAQSQIAFAYLVEVVQPSSGEIVHAYEVSSRSDVIPCSGRGYPLDYYMVRFRILDETIFSKSPTASSTTPFTDNDWVVLLVFAVPMVGLWLYFWQKRPPAPVPAEDHRLQIGQYCFDPHTMTLSLGEEEEVLTGKESELLRLLHESANTTLARERILAVVWGDEGNYVGRTLDVFISKLRKKLSKDPKISITNIRGIGYKLVINVA
ncbi:MAG: winged helix-turn-helix domain-containing protein [Bacteroidota bacterium]